MTDFQIDVAICKRSSGPIDEDRRLVAGFAYVSKAGGQMLYDTQGDAIDPEDLRDAVHDFVKSGRTMGVMHIEKDGKTISGGEIVEMAVLAGDFLPPGAPRDTEGLWIVAKVHDDAAWRMVKSGLLRAFSIGGTGVREAVT